MRDCESTKYAKPTVTLENYIDPRAYFIFGDLLAAGNAQAAWHSSDGIQWSRGQYDAIEVSGVTSIGQGLVVAGIAEGTRTAGIWWSRDGSDFDEFENLEWLFSHQFQYPGALAIGSETIVLVGFEQDQGLITTAVAAVANLRTSVSPNG